MILWITSGEFYSYYCNNGFLTDNTLCMPIVTKYISLVVSFLKRLNHSCIKYVDNGNFLGIFIEQKHTSQ